MNVMKVRIPLCPPELKACISRKTPKYRLFCYLQKTVSTAFLQLCVKKKQAKFTRIHTKFTRHIGGINVTKKPVLVMRAGFISNSHIAPSFHTNSLYKIKKYKRYCNPTYKVV